MPNSRRLLVVGVALRRARRAEDADLSHIAIGREDLQRIAQFLERFVDQLDVAAIGLVAQELERVGDDFADQIAVRHAFQLIDEPRCDHMNFGQLLAADYIRRLGAFLRLLDVICRFRRFPSSLTAFVKSVHMPVRSACAAIHMDISRFGRKGNVEDQSGQYISAAALAGNGLAA